MVQRRSLGYVENEWTCPNCNTRNKGHEKTCTNCGAPQPENVQFELASDQKFVTDQEQVNAAKAGSDIHCAYCGTRNSAIAKTCIQCGADLTEGKAREAGRIMQTPPPQPKTVTCSNCGTQNPGSNSVCSNCGSPLQRVNQAQAVGATPPVARSGIPSASTGKKNSKLNIFLIGGIVACLLLVCVGAVGLFLVPTASVQGTVTAVHWQTNVPVQELEVVQHTDEKSSPPSDAYNVSSHTEQDCQKKTVDKGNGYSEVVEECNNVTYYSYTVDEWKTVQTYTLQGDDYNPVYDTPNLTSDQRLGNKDEDLNVIFNTSKGKKTYSAGSETEFRKYQIGTAWTLKLNLVGGVVSVK
jgi:double zinc ribbon protein/zinc finger protein